jgi:hypothetical protein
MDSLEQRRARARQEFERQKAAFGLDEKFAAMQAMPDGEGKDAAAEEIVKWLFRD